MNSLKEFYRVLKDDGILIFKCQDKVSGGRQYFSHVFIINQAEQMGYYTKDMFVLLAKNRMTPKWQVKNQKNARKFHSYFLILQKSKKKIDYI
jgi:DNA modification methylase